MQVPTVSAETDALHLARTVLRLAQRLDQEIRRAQGVDGLSLAELGVLGQIDRGHDLPSVLARELHLDPPRVTRIADRLVSLGYIRRESDPADRRRCRLQLTLMGRERLVQGRAGAESAMAVLLEDLSDEEHAGLTIGLEGVRRVLGIVAGNRRAVGRGQGA